MVFQETPRLPQWPEIPQLEAEAEASRAPGRARAVTGQAPEGVGQVRAPARFVVLS